MNLLKTLGIGIGCVVLGVLGGFAARSWLAGIFLAVFVFVGWFLWRVFKSQEEKIKAEVPKEEKKE